MGVEREGKDQAAGNKNECIREDRRTDQARLY